tara:strand:- start:20 stop:148 length:129 start_codon:yes stop_codon:yes gene_type:complete
MYMERERKKEKEVACLKPIRLGKRIINNCVGKRVKKGRECEH